MAYGSIFEITKGRFRVCFDYGKDHAGKRIRKYQTFSSKADAKRALNRHKVQMDEGNYVLPADWLFAQWMDYWYKNIISPQIEATTAYGYQNIIENYLKPMLGQHKLQKLTPKHIQEYYTALLDNKGLSPSTVLKHHNLLTNMLNAAMRFEYIAKNPMDAVSPPRKKPHEAKYYTPEQLGKLLSLAAGTRLALPVYICAYLGLRRGELCGLRWQDIDFEQHTVTIDATRTQAGKQEIIKGTKTASSTRILYLPDTLEQMLRKEKEHQEECQAKYQNAYDANPYVIVMENGKPFRPNYLSELFKKFLDDHDLPKIVLHELRHPYVKHKTKTFSRNFRVFQSRILRPHRGAFSLFKYFTEYCGYTQIHFTAVCRMDADIKVTEQMPVLYGSVQIPAQAGEVNEQQNSNLPSHRSIVEVQKPRAVVKCQPASYITTNDFKVMRLCIGFQPALLCCQYLYAIRPIVSHTAV